MEAIGTGGEVRERRVGAKHRRQRLAVAIPAPQFAGSGHQRGDPSFAGQRDEGRGTARLESRRHLDDQIDRRRPDTDRRISAGGEHRAWTDRRGHDPAGGGKPFHLPARGRIPVDHRAIIGRRRHDRGWLGGIEGHAPHRSTREERPHRGVIRRRRNDRPRVPQRHLPILAAGGKPGAIAAAGDVGDPGGTGGESALDRRDPGGINTEAPHNPPRPAGGQPAAVGSQGEAIGARFR